MDAGPTLCLDASGRIREDILSGKLRSGQRLKLVELARRYRIGQTPLREALRELQGERLIDIVPNCGARVRNLDRAAISDMFEVRMVLEGLLARRAAVGVDHAACRRLHSIHENMTRQVARRDYPGALLENRAFHRAIGEFGGNEEAVAILERHWRVIPALWKSVDYAASRLPRVIADHLQILEAIESHDADAASSLAIAHVSRARRELLEHLRVVDSTDANR